jgi:hypothetical protein
VQARPDYEMLRRNVVFAIGTQLNQRKDDD